MLSEALCTYFGTIWKDFFLRPAKNDWRIYQVSNVFYHNREFCNPQLNRFIFAVKNV
jgi:hypothetical protein